MTVSSTTTRNSYTGDGTTTVFAYTFKIFDDDDITVILRTTATGTETVQTKTTDYSVSGVGDTGGGNITFGTPPTAAQTVVLLRQTAQTQTTDYTPNDPFPAASHEDALDKLTLIQQDQQDELDRAIKLSRTNTMTSTEFTVGASDRANKILAFDSSGELAVTQEIGTFTGDWASGTSYQQRDIIKDTSNDNIYIANTAHTSSGSEPISSNTDSAKWDLLVDAAAAATSASAAASSATAAAASATAAAASESAAATSETNAAASEAGVAADAAAAAASASAADTSATNASTSETNAAASASAASTSETNAATSATSASTSASAASTSASNAATSATNASNSASAASTSASNAATSETNAATSETNASNSASSASTSASNAATSAAAAEAAFDAFDDIYLGAKASAPTVDNDGDALTEGDQYFNTTNNTLFVWNGSAWQAASPDIVGDTTPQLGGNLDLNGNDITGTGNVDISGTLTADGLTVDGVSTLTSNSSADGILLNGRSDNISQFTFRSNDGAANYSQLQSRSTEMFVKTLANIPMSFHTNNTKRLSIENNGDISFYDSTGVTQGFFWDASTQRLGLGTTGPSTPLHISSTSYPQTRITNAISFNVGVDSSNNYVIDPISGTTRNIVMQNSGAGDINVGIGTAAPLRDLHVSNGGAEGYEFGPGESANKNQTLHYNRSTSQYIENSNRASQHTWDVGSSEAARIDSSQNFLVGKTTAGFANTGHQLNGGGSYAAFTRDGATPLLVNRKTSDGAIVEYMKDGTTVGSIGTENDDLTIGTGDTGLQFRDASDAIRPFNISTNTARDANIDLGRATERFRSLFLSNGIYLGGTGSANLLDDYEEGTWTPSINLDAGSISGSSTSGSYVKIGKQVTVTFSVDVGTATSADIASIGSLPFTVENTTQKAVGAVRENTNTGYMWHVRGNNNATTALLRRYDNASSLTTGDIFLGTLTYFTT